MQHDRPILVDFWADWCAPCRMMAPVLKELTAKWKGKITVIKIDTEQKPHLSRRYAITSIPTLVLFSDGKERHRISGAMPLVELEKEFLPFI